ncbi:MAG: hypothetical protein KKH98_01410 [Spirochaetes bacterium]|nr:hypothetical protein [Spirochaetota bacterium]
MNLKGLKNSYFYLMIFIFFMACTAEKEVLDPIILDSSKYNFESGLADGWIQSTFFDSRSISGVSASGVTSAVGDYSLCAAAHLVSGSDTLSKGEVYVDMRKYKPFGVLNIPLNLNSKTISVWTYVPGALSGPSTAPNGIQVFVKDINYNNWYSSFYKIGTPVATNSWYKIEALLSTAAGNYGFKDEKFDPEKIIIIGVKIGVADSSSNVNVNSQFYIDAISWE